MPGTELNVDAALEATIERARRSPLYAERLRTLRVRTPEELRGVPLTKRADLVAAGIHGTRALPLEEVCTTERPREPAAMARTPPGLTAADFARGARAIAKRHPDIFAPGHIVLNRFPFMAAPSHLIQLVAQQGGGVAIPAGNINWDVPFPRALELARSTGARVLAGFPLEPIILAQIARSRGLDPAVDLELDTFFLGGAALPPVMQRRIERVYGGRVVELYGSTETMLLGTACPRRTLHLEPDLVHCEVLGSDDDEVAVGEEGRLVVTTLGIEGSPLVRFDSGDWVRRLPDCECGDPRPAIVVLGRVGDTVEIQGRKLHPYDLVEAGAAAADSLDSSVFFTVVLPDRLVVRIESTGAGSDPTRVVRDHLGDVNVEIELVEPNALLDVETIGRSPSVYKPVLVSDWRRPGRQILTVGPGNDRMAPDGPFGALAPAGACASNQRAGPWAAPRSPEVARPTGQ